MDQDDFFIFRKALKEASLAAIANPVTSHQDIIYNHWVNAVHEILIREGCPCTKGNDEKCFLNINKETQIKLFSSKKNLSFENFLSCFNEARERAFDKALSNWC